MKKFLAIIAIASFVACNNSGDEKAANEDSMKRADSMRMADSTANANKMMQQDTGMNKMANDTSNKMQKK